VLADQFNLYGLKKTVNDYKDAFDVLTGDILGIPESVVIKYR
jgi:hypothetical protein